MENKIPRAEYPRPQLVRDSYICLNGKWMFEIDYGKTGRERGLVKAETLSQEIVVPFCPESKLSGVEHKDFMASVWYKREIDVTPVQGKRYLLHIGACDYSCEVYVNGESCGVHYGGSVSVDHDITDKLVSGKNVITICAEDDLRSDLQPGGKQSKKYTSFGCFYTRTTGIWQTVWMEEVPDAYISHIKATPNAETGEVYYEITCENANGMVLTCSATFDGEDMGSAGTTVMGKVARFVLPLKEKHLWDIGQGNLYDVSLLLGEDAVSSYFGLRDVYYDGRAMVLNGRRVYQRLVLDQGFYPDGIWTAPTDDELRADVERSMAMGFNGARLHQKVFEPRFLYYCDRLGYIVWGEHASWGLDIINNTCWAGFLPEWLEILRRDYNHPAIIGWCPLNETWRDQDRKFVEMLYDMTKAYDPYRMFIDCSGWYHMKTEVVDEHNYCQNPDELREYYETLSVTGQPKLPNPCTPYPTEYTPKGVSFISEYGGSGWDYTDGGIGHGELPATVEDFIARFKGLTDVLLDNPALSGFCYTQLTDVEQEQNGMYKYNRTPKFSAEIISAIVSRRAAIEKEN